MQIHKARAAILETLRGIREPTEGMLQAIMVKQARPSGDKLVLTDEDNDELQMIFDDWQAMIDTLIAEREPACDT